MITLKQIIEIANRGPYTPDWSSLSKHITPQWFKNKKFGIFIHWGLYSVPAFGNEWYSRNMYIKDSPEYNYHIKTYGEHKDFGYKDFIPLFRAEKFNAANWLEIIKKSGAKYIFPVAEHHDGFQMYESELSKYNSVNMGPKIDVLKELKNESEKQGIIFCTSSHRAEHFFFFGNGKDFCSDVSEKQEKNNFYWPAESEPDHFDIFSNPYPDKEFLDDWLMRTVEIVEKYTPKIIYFDWWIQHEAFKPYLKIFAAYYYNRGIEWNEEVSIAYKHDAMIFGSGIVEIEKGKFDNIQLFDWQTDTSIAKNSWCYTSNLEYKSSYELICDLIEIVSKNGNLLLNIGPKSDGTIPNKDKEILLEIGEWLNVNGEAIFETVPWKISQEGPTILKSGKFNEATMTYSPEDIRFTYKGNVIYAFILNPSIERVNIKSFKKLGVFEGIIKEVKILGTETHIEWTQTQEGLKINNLLVGNKQPVVLKIIVD